MARSLWLPVLGTIGAVGVVALIVKSQRDAPRLWVPRPQGPTPTPVPAQCDPLDPSTWPLGKICVESGGSWVLVDEQAPKPTPSPGPTIQYDTECSAIEVGDDHWLNSHNGLTEASDRALSEAVALGRDNVVLELGEGASDPGSGRVHTHRLILNGHQLDALASGATLEVSTLYTIPLVYPGDPFDEHTHTVRMACQKILV